jgi:thiamine biosynthesis lipoprotein
MRKTHFLPGLCCLLVLGCGASDTAQTVRQRFFAMGTWVDLTFESPAADTTAAALSAVEASLRKFERDYYPWTPGELAGLNDRIAAGRGTDVSPELARLLHDAQELSAASDGLFEPGLGRLVELWGFHSTEMSDREPPSAEAIDAALAASGGIAALRIEGTRIQSPRAGLKLDLGGIAKGAAVAQAISLLQSYGIDSALVNAGGDLAVTGNAPGGRPWRVGIRHPRGDGLLGTIELSDGESAFTSGDYERYYEHDGQRMHHLLDPHSGRPVTHTQALTVLADDPIRADAAATALFVAGPERWRQVADQLGIVSALRVDASGAIEMTQTMQARLQLPEVDHDTIMGSGQE